MDEIKTGRICQIQKNTYFIRYGSEELSGKLKGSYFNEYTDIPVVGDFADFRYNPDGDSIITGIHERKSVLKRPDYFHISTSMEQVMCANFDFVFIAVSLNGNYNFNRIARYVSVVLQGNGVPVVVLTKADLCRDADRYIREIEGLSEKVRVHAVSALDNTGIDELRQYLMPGTTIAILGSSGVGKSTLVNVLCGFDIMKTSAIREEDSKGRHTTTHRQMIDLPSGAVVIDTPGMREIGMCDVGDGISETFEDIKELELQCRFTNCRHDTEPGCAVKKAIEEGTLSKARLELYMNLYSESDKAAKMKKISKQRKALKYGRK